jgi:hypothetical protein
MRKIFVVVMPWNTNDITMKPVESFNTLKEAESYVDVINGWEIIEVEVPKEKKLCGCGEPATRLNHGFPICETCYDGLRSC